MGIPFAFGQRMLFDAHQRYVRSGLTVSLRVKNYLESNPDDGTSTEYLELGVPISPTGAAAVDTGYIDIPIDPPVEVMNAGSRDEGLFGGRMNVDSMVFWVSHTFVLAQMDEMNLSGDPEQVFRDRDGHKVIGLVHDGKLYSIEGITHRIAAGEYISWKIAGNALESGVAEQ